jgi:hypothetical protein
VIGGPITLCVDEPSYCARVKASVQSADDYGSIELAPLVVDEDWERSLREFIDLMELPASKDAPCWHLNCPYG